MEVHIASLPPGEMCSVKWRGQPVWVMRRTAAMLAALAALRERLLQPQVFVAAGVRTHLGCSPNAVAAGGGHPGLPDDGRVYRNMPAPTNLTVPPPRLAGASKLVIGEDDTA